MAENKNENEVKSTPKSSETKQPEINLGYELVKLIEIYNSRFDAICANIDQELIELTGTKTSEEFSPENKKQFDDLLVQKEEVGKRKLNISVSDSVSETINYFVETVFPARKDEMNKITASFLGRVDGSLRTENPEAIVAALKNLPPLYHTLPVKDVEKWAKPVESDGYAWPDKSVVDYYSLKTSVPVRKSGRPVLTALVAGLIGLAVGAGVVGVLSYKNIWNPAAQKAQWMYADCQSKNKSLNKSLIEQEDFCRQMYAGQTENFKACQQENEEYSGANAQLDSKVTVLDSENKSLAEKLKSGEEALQSANDNYDSCSKDYTNCNNKLEESQANSSYLSDKLNACEAAKTDLENKVVVTPQPVAVPVALAPVEPVPTVPVPETVAARTYTAQEIFDFIKAQPGQKLRVAGNDCSMVLSNTYRAMVGDDFNPTDNDQFVSDHVGFCDKINITPYSNHVILRAK